eukprot:scaffold4091_cov214-Skeletonema_marinoi.AAC.8
MYMNKSALFLFVATYGRGTNAALPPSCEENESSACNSSGDKCTPLGSQFEPTGNGQVWYSQCCTVSETSTDTPPVTESKKYCYAYTLQAWPSNQLHGIKPDCSENGQGNLAWTLEGQCKTDGTTDPYAPLTPASGGCPAQWDSSSTYEDGDTVVNNGVIYTCSGGAFCSINAPDLLGVGMNYWIPTNSCTGTGTGTSDPTASPTFGSSQAGCPEEYDSSTVYEADDIISIKREDGRSMVYTCKAFPASQFCNVEAYSPLNTDAACNGDICWPEAWTYVGGCTGSYTPTATPTFDQSDIGGCPEEYDSSTNYGEGDKVSVTPEGEAFGKLYECKTWPASDYCKMEAYSPLNTDAACNGDVCWHQAWTYVGGCTGTNSPTATPTFDAANVEGCPGEYDSSTNYGEGDKVSVTPEGEAFGKIYECKTWPASQFCNVEAYSPLNTDAACNGDVCWHQAWTYVGGCTGTNSPTATPTFDAANVEGCPEEYETGTDYGEGDKVSVTPEGEAFGKIYECKSWPDSGFCKLEEYKPVPGGAIHGENPLWMNAWTYVGGCTGTITPTGSPVFLSLPQWTKGGCPPEYVPNNPAYKAEDYVSVPTNDDNTYGVVWQCKNAMTAPWCQNEGYAPGTQNGGQAWEKMGFCDGTMSPTASPTTLANNPDPTKRLCQFKYNLATGTDGEYVVLQAESWENGGKTIPTVTGGTPLDLFKAGNLVRNGDDARECNSYPYSGYCDQYSPFVQDSSSYNAINSPLGWKDATCEDVVSKGDTAAGTEDEFSGSNFGPVFASNDNLLVSGGLCQTGEDPAADSGAINPEDYFKSSPAVKGCQQCASTDGFGSPNDPKKCITCQAGTTSAIVDGKSQCVCDNGATDPWATAGSQCQACPAGGKYLGPVANLDGDGECEAACPAAFPLYTSKDNGSTTYKLCCKEAGCTSDGGIADCFDGTGNAKTYCQAAGATAHPTTSPSAAPSETPSDVPSAVPSEAPSEVPSKAPSDPPV